jgi:hypothetical protein
MHDGAELRRAEEFLQDIEKNRASSPTDSVTSSLPTCSPKSALQQSSGDSQCPTSRNPSTHRHRRSAPSQLNIAPTTLFVGAQHAAPGATPSTNVAL